MALRSVNQVARSRQFDSQIEDAEGSSSSRPHDKDPVPAGSLSGERGGEGGNLWRRARRTLLGSRRARWGGRSTRPPYNSPLSTDLVDYGHLTPAFDLCQSLSGGVAS